MLSLSLNAALHYLSPSCVKGRGNNTQNATTRLVRLVVTALATSMAIRQLVNPEATRVLELSNDRGDPVENADIVSFISEGYP